MAVFPRLKTGAVAQYPTEQVREFRTKVTQFVDGKEQRYRECGNPVIRWRVRLDLLDEEEARGIQAFFSSQSGRLGVFEFQDPHTGAVHSNCSFDQEECVVVQDDENHNSTTLIIRTV